MIVLIQSVCMVFTEVLFYKWFIESFCDYKSKLHRDKSFIILILTFLETLGIAFLLDRLFVLKEFLLTLLLSLTVIVFFQARLLKLITLTAIYFGLIITVEYITYMIYSDLFVIDPNFETITQTLAMILAKMVEFLIILIIQRITDQFKGALLTDSQWTKFLFFPVFSICILSVIQSNSYLLQIKEYENLLWMAALGLLGMNIFVFYLMQDISKQELHLRENKIAEVNANNQLLLYQSIVENYEKQNKKLHEYKNQIECLQTLNRDKHYIELDRYLNQIGEELFHELDAVDTHHAVINAIINAKYHEAMKHNIIMVFKLDDLSKLWLREHDIVVILANLLDNAIEACKKIESRRVIKVKMIIEKSNLVLSVSNTYNGSIKSREGILLSTKENRSHEHGIGIGNIIRTVKKYAGNYLIEPQETEFIFSIIIPKNAPNSARF